MKIGKQCSSRMPHPNPMEKTLLQVKQVGSWPMPTTNTYADKCEMTELGSSNDEGLSQHPPRTPRIKNRILASASRSHAGVKGSNDSDSRPNIGRGIWEMSVHDPLLPFSFGGPHWKIHDLPLITRATSDHVTTTLTSTESISTQTSSNSRITLETRASSVSMSPMLADNGGPAHLATQQQPISDKFLLDLSSLREEDDTSLDRRQCRGFRDDPAGSQNDNWANYEDDTLGRLFSLENNKSTKASSVNIPIEGRDAATNCATGEEATPDEKPTPSTLWGEPTAQPPNRAQSPHLSTDSEGTARSSLSCEPWTDEELNVSRSPSPWVEYWFENRLETSFQNFCSRIGPSGLHATLELEAKEKNLENDTQLKSSESDSQRTGDSAPVSNTLGKRSRESICRGTPHGKDPQGFGNGDDGPSQPQRPRVVDPAEDPSTATRFACPYQKRFPSQNRLCGLPHGMKTSYGWCTVSRVKYGKNGNPGSILLHDHLLTQLIGNISSEATERNITAQTAGKHSLPSLIWADAEVAAAKAGDNQISIGSPTSRLAS